LEKQWGVRILEEWWNTACKNLGVKGVSLYPGTKHSTANILRHLNYTPEQIREFLGHRTGTAFRRYYLDDRNEQLEMVQALAKTGSDTRVIPYPGGAKEANLLN
jgi:hypothetical protein